MILTEVIPATSYATKCYIVAIYVYYQGGCSGKGVYRGKKTTKDKDGI